MWLPHRVRLLAAEIATKPLRTCLEPTRNLSDFALRFRGEVGLFGVFVDGGRFQHRHLPSALPRGRAMGPLSSPVSSTRCLYPHLFGARLSSRHAAAFQSVGAAALIVARSSTSAHARALLRREIDGVSLVSRYAPSCTTYREFVYLSLQTHMQSRHNSRLRREG